MNKNPTVHLAVTLDELNYTLQALAARPFIEVQELIAKLQAQGLAGVKAAAEPVVKDTPAAVEPEYLAEPG